MLMDSTLTLSQNDYCKGKKKSDHQVLAKWNKEGNIGKHNWSHLGSVIHLAGNSSLCNYGHKYFSFQGGLNPLLVLDDFLTQFWIFAFLYLFSPYSLVCLLNLSVQSSPDALWSSKKTREEALKMAKNTPPHTPRLLCKYKQYVFSIWPVIFKEVWSHFNAQSRNCWSNLATHWKSRKPVVENQLDSLKNKVSGRKASKCLCQLSNSALFHSWKPRP